MKQLNDRFYDLYEKHKTLLEPESSLINPMITYRNVLKKAGLAQTRNPRKRVSRVLLIAAVLAVSALTVAAAVYRASDAFRGVLRVHGNASSTDEMINRTGQVINETSKSGTVDMSLRAAVGDGRTLKVLVDVADRSGKGLAIAQADKNRPEDAFALKTYEITKANGEVLAGSANYSFINVDPSGGKFTILFDYSVMDEAIGGEPLKLRFEDILQSADLKGTALDMGPDDLHKIVSGFKPYGSSDFILSSSIAGKNYYLLHKANPGAGQSISRDYADVKVTAATVKDGALYLQGTAGAEAALEKLLDHAALRGSAGGMITAADVSIDGKSWSIRFDGVDSLEALKGYVWYYGAGEGFHTAYEGAWDFTFQADMDDLAVKLTPNVKTTWEGHQLTVSALEISPYSLFLQYSTDRDTALRMFPPFEWGSLQTSDWINSGHPVTLTMQDGSTVQVTGGSLAPKGGNLAAVPAGTVITEYEMQYDIGAVIDPRQVASVKIGSEAIPLHR